MDTRMWKLGRGEDEVRWELFTLLCNSPLISPSHHCPPLCWSSCLCARSPVHPPHKSITPAHHPPACLSPSHLSTVLLLDPQDD